MFQNKNIIFILLVLCHFVLLASSSCENLPARCFCPAETTVDCPLKESVFSELSENYHEITAFQSTTALYEDTRYFPQALKVEYFQSFPSLQFIRLQKCSLTEISYDNSNEKLWKNLEFLSLNENLIGPNLDSHSLPNLPKLKSLLLDGNKVEKIMKDTFSSRKFPELTVLSINNNLISEIDENSFKLPELEQLYLNNNSIKSVQHKLVLPKLHILSLASNEISNIPTKVFYVVKSLKFINLRKVPLLNWVEIITFLNTTARMDNQNMLEISCKCIESASSNQGWVGFGSKLSCKTKTMCSSCLKSGESFLYYRGRHLGEFETTKFCPTNRVEINDTTVNYTGPEKDTNNENMLQNEIIDDSSSTMSYSNVADKIVIDYYGVLYVISIHILLNILK